MLPLQNIKKEKGTSMKRYFSIIITALLFVSICFTACSDKNSGNTDEDSIGFDSLIIKEKKHLFNDTTKSFATVQFNLKLPQASTPEKSRQFIYKSFLNSLFEVADTHQTIEKVAEIYIRNYFNDYIKLEKDYLDLQKKHKTLNEEDAEYASSETLFSYENNIKLEITYNKNGVLSYVVRRYEYTGGAHGMNTDTYTTLLVEQGKTIKQEDLFDEENYEKLATLIVNNLVKANSVEDPSKLEEIGFFSVKEIMPNGNISVCDKGITWSYNPYDIAAYAIGTVAITVPYKELKPYFKPNHPLTDFINIIQ